MSDKIKFGEGFTAEPRGDGEYYIAHPNGGGAMAGAAESALLRALVAARTERDFARGEHDAYRHERDALALLLADVYEHLEIEAPNEALTARIEAAAYLFRDAVVAARKQQEGGPQ